jgi:predicted RNA-binding Zn-ribbon protein involved in translation (DUF1610 family)
MKKMKWPFIALIIAGIILMFLAGYDIVLNKGYFQHIVAAYLILIILAILLIVITAITTPKPKELFEKVEEFKEGAEEEGVSHFKCPKCNAHFALQELKFQQNNLFKMTCPSCGIVGKISLNPQILEEKLPKTKSRGLNFKCTNCEEEMVIWLEGNKKILDDTKILICPNCGADNSVIRL